jgi:GNAT superfamily N-acetyltransferase
VAEVKVRALRREDKPQWLALWAGYNDFYRRVGRNAVPAEVTETTFARFFDAYEPMHCLVAEQEGALLGLVHFLYHRNTTMIGPACYLQDLFTAREARGKGVGRALIEAVYAAAREAGSPRVYWQTQISNTTAQALYDTLAEKTDFIVYRKLL